MGYDGWVTIGTKLDSKQLEKDLKQAEKRLKEFEKEGEKLTSKKADIEVKLKGIDKAKKDFDEAKRKYEDLKKTVSGIDTSTPTGRQEYFKADEDLRKAYEEAENFSLKVTEAKNEYNQVSGELDDINQKLIENAKNQELVKGEIEDTNRKLTQARGTQDIKDAMNDVAKATSKSIQQVGKWALAVFGLRSAYMFVRNAASKLSQYNEQIAADLEYMSYALAVALQPVIESMIQLAYKLLQYINYIAQAWFGVNIFANASADAMNKTASSAKELRKALAGFDEMNLVSGGASNASAGGTTLPSVDLTKPEDGPAPEWLQWIVENKDLIISALTGTATALNLVKLGIDGILGTGIGIIIAGIIGLVMKVNNALADLDISLENNGTSWKQIGDILLYIGLVLAGLALAIGSIPLAIAAAVVAVIAALVAGWDTIKGWFNTAINWLYEKAEWLSSKGEFLLSTFLVIVAGVIDTVSTFFGGLFTSIKNIIDGILILFKGEFEEGFISIGKGIANAFITVINTVVAAINTVWTGMLNIVDAAGNLFGQKWNLSADLAIPKIPYLAVGGIINMPGRGVPLGSAFGGESGAEGVIPLTDEQAMETLGESIGRHITINASVTNTMNGRVISRELKKLVTEDDFATNG